MESKKNIRLSDEEINQLSKKDKYNYLVSQVDPDLIEKWKLYDISQLLIFQQNKNKLK